MGYCSVTASGDGVKGNLLPHSGTVTLTTRTSFDGGLYVYPYLDAINEQGDFLSTSIPASDAGGSWGSGYSFYINNNNTPEGSVTVNMAAFKSAFSDYSDLAGLRLRLLFNVLDEEYFDFLLDAIPCYWDAGATCSVNKTLSNDIVELSWGGSAAGFRNAITGYEVQYCESSDGLSWGEWTALNTVSSTATGDSTSVSPSSTYGNYRKFRVRTQGAAGSDYYSDWLESANVLRRDHAALSGFTDSTLTAGTSPVKALHMTELQDRVNTLRTFYGLSAYSFTTITAGTTGLSGWTAHVNQIRTAIEDVCTASGKTHATWISFTANCPRADIIQQLRSVILAL